MTPPRLPVTTSYCLYYLYCLLLIVLPVEHMTECVIMNARELPAVLLYYFPTRNIHRDILPVLLINVLHYTY